MGGHQVNGYQTDKELLADKLGIIVGRWYWVTYDNKEWFPALWDEYLGWSNSDCWDDRHNEVIAWKLIPLPEVL